MHYKILEWVHTEQKKPVTFEKLCVSVTGLLPSVQYLEAEGTVVNERRP